jgi:hypothetical protein
MFAQTVTEPLVPQVEMHLERMDCLVRTHQKLYSEVDSVQTVTKDYPTWLVLQEPVNQFE